MCFTGQTVRSKTPHAVRFAAGDTVLGVAELGIEGWHEIELGPFDWPAGEPLVLTATWEPGEAARVIVDRTDLDWQ